MTIKQAFATENRLVQRVCTYIFGLFLMSISSNLAVCADIGNSAMNSFCGVLALQTGYTLGNVIIVVGMFQILGQLLLLGKEFKPYNIAQVPFAIAYGQMVDFVGWLMPELAMPTYGHQLVALAAAVMLLATGITFFVGTELVPMPLEGLALAIGQKTPIPFHRGKSLVDTCLLIFGVILSFVFFGRLEVIREGTVVLALGTGWFVGIVRPRMPRWVQNWRLGT